MGKLKYAIARFLYRRKLRQRLKECVSNESKDRILLLNVPSHGNLGDHLISVAEKQLVKDIKGYEPLTFTTADLYYGIDLIENVINPCDVVLITGGGYLGSLWPEEEARVLKLVNDLRDNTIVVLPQTVYYDQDNVSRKMMADAQKTYSRRNEVFLTVREKRSLDVVNKDLGLPQSQSALLPDMALYLNFSNHDRERDGIILCIRNDKEKGYKGDLMSVIKENVDGRNVRYLDTQVNRSVSQSDEDREVRGLIEQFQSAQLVITDRLHGMLYATICGTPVIALDNYSHKVKNVYECWLKDLDYVRFVDNVSELPKSMTELLDNGAGEYNSERYRGLLQSYLKEKI